MRNIRRACVLKKIFSDYYDGTDKFGKVHLNSSQWGGNCHQNYLFGNQKVCFWKPKEISLGMAILEAIISTKFVTKI